MSDFDQIIDLFRQEAGEHLAALEKGFLDLEGTDSVEARGSITNKIFRAAHSLKGAARAVELNDIQDCAQKLEETLDELRENPAAVTTEAIESGLAQFDELRKAFDQWKGLPIADCQLPIEEKQIGNQQLEIDNTFSVRVSSDRLDRMLSLAGELRISQRAADLHAQQLRGLPIADLRFAICD